VTRHLHPGAVAPEATPDALRPPPGNPRFPLVDGLRAVAALSVVVTHTAFISGFNGHGLPGEITARLDIGVALFFVISGFLLYRPFVSARMEGRPGPRVPLYFRRRAIRIIPAYWLALTVLAIWPGLPFVHGPDWWAYYGFLQDFRVIWIQGGLKTAWSLCVEVQFYLLLPVYAIAVQRWLSGRTLAFQARTEYGVLALLAALSLWARSLSFADRTPDTISSTIVGTFMWFTVGMAFAVASAQWHRRPAAERPALMRVMAARPGSAWVAALILLLGLTQIGMPVLDLNAYDDNDWYWGHLFYAAIAGAFALPAMLGEPVAGRRDLPARVLGWRPVAWLGLISYGIFLWHLPLTEKLLKVQDWTPHGSFFVFTAVVMVVAVACASASYYLVEKPLLRFKDPRPPRAPQREVDFRPTGSSATARDRARAAPEASPTR
jgi:peptidoglycan/LPS O-acetylase OafA/YrhL